MSLSKLSICLALLCVIFAAAQSVETTNQRRELEQYNPSYPRCVNRHKNEDRYGGEIPNQGLVQNVYSEEECCQLCKNNPACNAYTWWSEHPHLYECYLKDQLNSIQGCENKCYGGRVVREY